MSSWQQQQVVLKVLDLIKVLVTPGAIIGFGKGSYDQYIADEKNIANNLKSVGVCFNFQLRNFVIKELHDQKMDYIVTEQMIIRCSDRINYNNV